MKTLNNSIYDYGRQVENGDIRFAYQGLINYILKLKLQLKEKYPEYNISKNFYQGYMDISFFSLAPEKLKQKNLKIAVVYIHEKTRFEVWLTGRNSEVQSNYRHQFKKLKSKKYLISPDKKGVTSIIESVLVDKPNFDRPDKLTKAISIGVRNFLEDIEKLLDII